mmetsp:Transcript_28328/g.77769  ORF Transcript_28328/g.77769 Transcript_28328/m.77769 type:complete len:267 (+) Transcript_28328:185-985(+)|eukprot:CAMPEP_0168726680 /NCGR_PEP_ID=MMETSP0724-20121128/4791_1 /TAXON_ID=265536 /ORGANISM="Amphiprora sp., Strain CCMP467" /LENGTH=266 /DNA_ID=CAMNT_0008773497 /DNA_START=170 /DNA_END=970 /DNA_ORIENTATION=+
MSPPMRHLHRRRRRQPRLALGLVLWAVVSCATALDGDTDDDGGTPSPPRVSFEFLDACTHGPTDRVVELLHRHPTWTRGTSSDGETCLHVAGIYGQAAVTRAVLEFRSDEADPDNDNDDDNNDDSTNFLPADPNVRTTYDQGLRMTPLAWNVYAGHVETARVLLEHGADPNLDFDGSRAAGTAAAASDASDTVPTQITCLDVVQQMLSYSGDDNDSGDDPNHNNNNPHNVDKFRLLEELLLAHGAKTFRDWTTATSNPRQQREQEL